MSFSLDQMIRIWDIERRELISTRHGTVALLVSISLPLTSHLDTSVGPLEDNSEMDDGWILGSSSELLFWVPPSHRTGLWRPRNVGVIGEGSTKLDFSRFVHGTSWAQCYEQGRI